MTSRLFVRETGQREFVKQNGDFSLEQDAIDAGEQLCMSGNVDAFEVWTLVTACTREWRTVEAAGALS